MLNEAFFYAYHLTVLGPRALMVARVKEIKMQNYTDQFQVIDSNLLAAAARGEIDLNHLARMELANRGQGTKGEWVGFDQAKQIHNLK